MLNNIWKMLKAGEKYRERAKSIDRDIYVKGEKVDLEHPNLQPIVNSIAYTYELAKEKNYTAPSSIIDEDVNILNHIISNQDELMKRYDYQKELSRDLATCNYRCTGSDAINALSASLKGEPKQKLENILAEVQENDYACTGGLTDPKGDRTKRPTETEEMYVRVVDKDDDGIYISGAKMHQSGAPAADLTFILPGQMYREGEEKFSVAFAVKPEEDDVTYVLQNTGYQALFREENSVEEGNPKYGDRITSMVLFDETFIPEERVFVNQDIKAGRKILSNFGSSHRCVGAACKSGYIDSMAGAANLAIKSKGLEDVDALQNKVGEIVAASEATYGIAAGGAFQGNEQNGAWLPNPKISNAGKVAGVDQMEDAIRKLGEIAGGIPVTAPSKDDLDSEIGETVSKYLEGPEFTPEERLKIMKFIEFWTTSNHFLGGIHGGGSPGMALMTLQALTDLDSREESVKKNLDI